jgi:hypothetical protein
MKEAIEEVGIAVAHDLERFLTTGHDAAMAPLLGLFGRHDRDLRLADGHRINPISSLAASRSRSITRR